MINVLSTLVKTNIEQQSTLRELIAQGRVGQHASSCSSSSFSRVNAYLPQELPVQQSTPLNPWSIDQITPAPIEQMTTVQPTQQIQQAPNFQEQQQVQEQAKLQGICKGPIPRV